MTDHRDIDLAESGAMGSPAGDPELITRVRGGDRQAFAELYRRHVGAATNLARQIVPGAGADDLVSEAFARVLDGLLEGKGPDAAFRAYVFTTVRNTANDRFRRDKRVTFTDDQAAIDSPVSDPDIVMLQAENGMVGQAYQSLPERWQAVLWYLTVEGYSPAKTGELLGLSANAVTSLAFRAREGLREAYLQAHLLQTEAEQCSSIVGKLGAWTRDGLSRRERSAVDAHLDSCPDCRSLASELGQINSGMRALLAPLLLGGAALAYLKLVGPATAIAKIGLIGAGATGTAATTAGTGVGAASLPAGAGAATGTTGTAASGTAATGTAASGTAATGTAAAGTTAAGTSAVGTTAVSTTAVGTGVGTGVASTGAVGSGLIGTGVVSTAAVGTGVGAVGAGAGVIAGGIATTAGVGLVSAGGIGAGLAAVGISTGFGGLGSLLVGLPKTVMAAAGSTISGAAVAGAVIAGTPAQVPPPQVATPAPVVVPSTVRTPAGLPTSRDDTVVIRTSTSRGATPNTAAAPTTDELVPLPILDSTETSTEDSTAATTATSTTAQVAPGVTTPAAETTDPGVPTPTTGAEVTPTGPTATDIVVTTPTPTTPAPTTPDPGTTPPTDPAPTDPPTSTPQPPVTTTPITTPPVVPVALPTFGALVGLTSDLDAGTFTLVQDIRNNGTVDLTGAVLTAGNGLLQPASISATVTSAARIRRASTALGCATDGTCDLPVVAAGSTARVTVTLTAPEGTALGDLRATALALKVTAGTHTANSSVPVAPAVPVITLSEITAGVSNTLDVMLTSAPDSALPTRVGLAVDDDRLWLSDDGAGCATPNSSSVDCPVKPTGTGAAVQVAVNALPDARSTTAQLTVGRFTDSADITVGDISPQISLTGPFQVSSTGAAIGQTCVGTSPASDGAPTACATDIPATATILWAELVWTWATEPAQSDTDVTLFYGDPDNTLTLGPGTLPTFFQQDDGEGNTVVDAAYRSAPIVLDAAARAALVGGEAPLGVTGPTGATGGWTVVALWTDDSVSTNATVQIDGAVQVVRAGDSVIHQAGTTASLFDLDATADRSLLSWTDFITQQIVQLASGARLFPGAAGGQFTVDPGAAHGLLYGPVITPR